MAKKTNWGISAFKQTAVPDSLTSGSQKQVVNQDHWSEDFQDLSNYCNTGLKMADNSAQPLGEKLLELNTPVIVPHDFNFGVYSTPGDRLDDDPWGAQNEKINTSQTDEWYAVDNWLSSNNGLEIDDREDMVEIGVEIDAVDETNIDVSTTEEKPFQEANYQQQLISSDRDFLLSQSSDFKQQTLPVMSEANTEESLWASIIKPEPQYCDQSSIHEVQVVTMKTINNNNSTVDMNVLKRNNNNVSSSLPKKQGQQNHYVLQPAKGKSAFVDGSLKNRKDPANNNIRSLSSLFKSEEPLIGESGKQFLSCTTSDNINNNNVITSAVCSNNNNNVTVAAIIIPSESIATTSTGLNNIIHATKYNCTDRVSSINSNVELISSDLNTSYIIPDPIKAEPMDSADIEVETINEKTTNTVIRSNLKPSKLYQQTMKKPNLKLDIDSARVVTSNITPITTPTTSILNLCNNNSTPEVMRLFNSKDFDLLSFISGDGNGDDLISPSVAINSGKSSPIIDKKNILTLNQQPKTSKPVIVEKLESVYKPIQLTVVKEEKEEDNDEVDAVKEEKPCIESHHVITYEDSFMSSLSSSRYANKRRRTLKKSEESDYSYLSDSMEEDDEKHDKTFTLSTPYRRKRTMSTASRTSTEFSRSSERLPSYGKQRKMSRDTDSSDHESIMSSTDKYRELRDRNNEASRRSRLNRKSRETEMKEQAFHLETENMRLKAKANEMERLVNRLREGIIELVSKKKN